MKVSQTGIRKLSIIALTFLCSVNAFAKDNCDTQASLINPASLAQSGIGETGNTADNDGIGGTDIIGTITGFASICVNGIEIHYDKHTAISVDGRGATLGELAVGQVIAVRAFGAGGNSRHAVSRCCTQQSGRSATWMQKLEKCRSWAKPCASENPSNRATSPV
ncbi:MAG: hypothetical protein JSR71_02575 [Proteobacteria bacterium]|nr:hypothetical protein [Pseudomonadota bacterium]